MKLKYCIILIGIPFLIATECGRGDNFFPDPYNPGLSRFTSRGYNVASVYLNGVPFGNNGQTYSLLQKDTSGSAIDTLKFAWPIYPLNTFGNNFIYQNISFLIPVSSSFNKNDLLSLNGKRLLDSSKVVIQQIQDASLQAISGTASLYFVAVKEDLSYPPQKYIRLSGLFDGNIGDTVLIAKGRFDFEINENDLNF